MLQTNYTGFRLHRKLIMPSVNPCFKTKKVLSYVATLISDYDYNYFDDLAITEKEEFASLLIEAAGRDGEFECLTESTDSDLIINFLKSALKSGSKENDVALLEAIKDSAISYYDHIMRTIFDHVNEDYRNERNEWLDRACKEGDADEALDRYMDGL